MKLCLNLNSSSHVVAAQPDCSPSWSLFAPRTEPRTPFRPNLDLKRDKDLADYWWLGSFFSTLLPTCIPNIGRCSANPARLDCRWTLLACAMTVLGMEARIIAEGKGREANCRVAALAARCVRILILRESGRLLLMQNRRRWTLFGWRASLFPVGPPSIRNWDQGHRSSIQGGNACTGKARCEYHELTSKHL